MSIAMKQFCLLNILHAFIGLNSFRKTCLMNYFLKVIWL